MPTKTRSTIPQSLALITGASSGIGLEFARVLAGEGNDLLLVSQDETKLRHAAKELQHAFPSARITHLAADLSDAKGVQKVIDAVRSQKSHVHTLINNAGYALYGRFWETDSEQETRMLELNIIALTRLTKAFLPAMIARKRGIVVNVASTAAFQPGPLMATYYASKAYVLSFSEAIANETQGTGVSVTCLCPGPTESNFQSRAKMLDSRIAREGRLMPARVVAEEGWRGAKAGKSVVIPGLRNQLGTIAARLAPGSLSAQVVRNIQERKKE
ncbi:MAG: SDR family oxidoreductase [Candidatus Iainarchaeum archaeon]|uniref:SDR family oxidoreductase n=1 Tax=Candidatus Iainarchaeum sp. TaxID=3101447 RepID=A0A7T9DKP2_9ARCH|nr:MAG: SDR family oxidoreductase [Candidatus Diapherotrites archaeon]